MITKVLGLNKTLGNDIILKISKLIDDNPNKIKIDPKIAIKSNNKSIIVYIYILISLYYYALVAQWIARLTSNQAVAGSSPARVVCFWLLVRGFPVRACRTARGGACSYEWGISSIGRVRALQARGTGIETRILHFPFCS